MVLMTRGQEANKRWTFTQALAAEDVQPIPSVLPSCPQRIAFAFTTPPHGITHCPICAGTALTIMFFKPAWDHYGRCWVPAWATLNCYYCGRWLATYEKDAFEQGGIGWQKRTQQLSNGSLLEIW